MGSAPRAAGTRWRRRDTLDGKRKRERRLCYGLLPILQVESLQNEEIVKKIVLVEQKLLPIILWKSFRSRKSDVTTPSGFGMESGPLAVELHLCISRTITLILTTWYRNRPRQDTLEERHAAKLYETKIPK